MTKYIVAVIVFSFSLVGGLQLMIDHEQNKRRVACESGGNVWIRQGIQPGTCFKPGVVVS